MRNPFSSLDSRIYQTALQCLKVFPTIDFLSSCRPPIMNSAAACVISLGLLLSTAPASARIRGNLFAASVGVVLNSVFTIHSQVYR